MVNVGKYTIHGSYGIESWLFNRDPYNLGGGFKHVFLAFCGDDDPRLEIHSNFLNAVDGRNPAFTS